MKFFIACVAIGMLLTLNSCGYVERDFLGEWEVYELELKSEFRGNIVDDEMREFYKTVSYEFLPEGKMIYKQGRFKSEGTWRINDEELYMNYSFENSYGGYREDELQCKILSCTAGKMALSLKFQENETWVLYFKLKE
jgi:hypothetical protein